jgi:hypothetical protein
MTNQQTTTEPEVKTKPTGDLHGPKAMETVSKLTREQLEAALAELEEEEENG